MFIKLILPLLIAFSVFSWDEVPPQSVTGSLCTESDPDFYEYRYPSRMPYCKRNVSSKTKDDIYRASGIPLSQKSQFTIDHFYGIAAAQGSNHIDNLWAEPKYVKDRRGNMEFNLYQGIKSGCLSVEFNQEILSESKLNINIMMDRPYASFETLYDYAEDRGIPAPDCAKWIFTNSQYGE